MNTSRLLFLQDTWRVPPPPSTMPATMQSPMINRPMLACPDGSFIPLVAKSQSSAQTHVYEVDALLCPDVQIVTKRSTVAGTIGSPMPERKLELDDSMGRRLEAGPGYDYQQRINAIVADSHTRERPITQHSSHVSYSLAPQHRHVSSIPSLPTSDGKEYCSYWIRTGECDYVQQGCRYRHEMPPLEKLKDIGFAKYPRWWLEKVQYARPHVGIAGPARARGDVSAIRRIVEAQLGRSRENSEAEKEAMDSRARMRDVGHLESGNEGGSESSMGVLTPVRQRVVALPSAMPPQATNQTPSTPTAVKCKTPPATVTTAEAIETSRNLADLLDLISDTDSDSLQPALKAPPSSPHSISPDRQGRFVPFNERVTKVAAAPAPPRLEVRSPSPLLLDSHPVVAMKTSAVNNVIPRTSGGTSMPSHRSPVSYRAKFTNTSELAAIQKVQQRSSDPGAENATRRRKTATITTSPKGLHKSKYAGNQEKKHATPVPIIESSTSQHRERRQRRGRQSTPTVARKTVSTSALAGLEESRERDTKGKEHVVVAQAEEKVMPEQASMVSGVRAASAKPSYKYLFERGV